MKPTEPGANEWPRYIAKAIATLASAGVCSVLIWQTHGDSGMLWFAFILFVIW
jgi:hypothetical protein